MTHKAGFVNIIGNANVGKSTLMNFLTGEKLSIITSKAQTTRHRIKGLVNTDDFQVVFSDTPGLLKPNYMMQEMMLKTAKTAFTDADIILFVTDVYDEYEEGNDIIKLLNKQKIPVILLINKIDISHPAIVNQLIEKWKILLPKAEIYSVSALKGDNVLPLFQRIVDILPENPPYYPKDMLTDKPEKFFVSEIIREKILLYYRKEIPYSVEIMIEEFKEEGNLVKIRAIIYVERESQKGIVIGNKGLALKKTGTEARKDIEKFLNKKVFLELYVKVDPDWRSKAVSLKKFGYGN
ncbi:MAG: GTPase Era [Bacteroidota bacterium]